MKTDERSEILKLICVDKNYKLAEKILKSNRNDDFRELLAKLYFLRGRYGEALKIYKSLGMPLFAGYCELFSGNKKGADKFWSLLEGNSCAELWVKFLSKNIDNPSTEIAPS